MDILMTKELLPCPFCGSKPRYGYDSFFNRHSYSCSNVMCDFNPSDYAPNITKEEAIENWNTRTPPPATVPHIEGGLWTGIKALDEIRNKAASSGSGCVTVSIEELNKIGEEAARWVEDQRRENGE